jgi:hypothetical protein
MCTGVANARPGEDRHLRGGVAAADVVARSASA